MKRYMPTIMIVGFELTQRASMQKFEGGSYVRYEDVKTMVELLLDECGQDEITAESFIKEWE